MAKFKTDRNKIIPAVTSGQMREIDRIAIEETGPNLFQMMENAGRSLAWLTLNQLGDNWNDAKILVLAGSGGNGGGGICCARHLLNHKADVSLCLAKPDRLGEVPSFQRKIYRKASGVELSSDELKGKQYDIIIDALIGYGLKSAPYGIIAELIQWAKTQSAKILSLDVPSGVNATTGERPGDFIKPGITLTLALPKTGLFSENTGDLFLADIGIPSVAYKQIGLDYSSPFDNRFIIPVSHD